jgi:hypothetical protein
MNWKFWKKKEPPKSAFILLKGSNVTDEIQYQCTICGSKWQARGYRAMSDGLDCGLCGAHNQLSTVQYWMRKNLASSFAGTCIHCFKEKTDHAGTKCLFGPGQYQPRGELGP